MEHVVLLGDSILDNAPYVPVGTDVRSQLAAHLGEHAVSLLARDGAVLDDMAGQIARLASLRQPPTWLVVSCGGNDVLGLVGAMHSPVRTVLEAAELLAAWQAGFREKYRRMLEALQATGWPLAVATIYDSVPNLGEGLRTALTPFNDVIVREAVVRGLPLLDLRLVCQDAQDYAPSSPIEPSSQGGRKIAAAIAELVQEQEAGAPRTVVYGAGVR